MELFTIKDLVANRCGPVFQAVNSKVAQRSMRQMLEKVDPSDFEEFKLFHIGSFNEESGKIIPLDPQDVTENREVRHVSQL